MRKMARVGLTMTPEKKQSIIDHANSKGESVNSFILHCVDEQMERENQK